MRSISPIKPLQSNAVQLFETGDAYCPGPPASFGFGDLILPDAYRPIRRQVSCHLPPPTASGGLWVQLTTNKSGHDWHPYLTVHVNDRFAGTQAIGKHGPYFFQVPADAHQTTGEWTVTLTVNHEIHDASTGKPFALPLYELNLIDVGPAAEFEERRLFEEQLHVFDREAADVNFLFQDMPTGKQVKALEVGAGDGWSSALLSMRTEGRVWGIDVKRIDREPGLAPLDRLLAGLDRQLPLLHQTAGFEHVQHRSDLESAVDRCQLLVMSAESLDFKDDMFDLVYSLNAFEHIPNPDLALKEIARVLKPGGQAVILFNLLYHCDGGSHLHACGLLDVPWPQLLYSREEIRQMILEAGNSASELDAILDSLNGWTAARFMALFNDSSLDAEILASTKCFTIEGSENSPQFAELLERYPEEELTTMGIVAKLRKPVDEAPSNRWRDRISRALKN